MEEKNEMKKHLQNSEQDVSKIESEEQLDFSELEDVEGGGVIVVGCGKQNGRCSLHPAENTEKMQ